MYSRLLYRNCVTSFKQSTSILYVNFSSHNLLLRMSIICIWRVIPAVNHNTISHIAFAVSEWILNQHNASGNSILLAHFTEWPLSALSVRILFKFIIWLFFWINFGIWSWYTTGWKMFQHDRHARTNNFPLNIFDNSSFQKIRSVI